MQSTIVRAAAVADEFLKCLHCYVNCRCCHLNRHFHRHYALCTVDHFYLSVHLRLLHHLINCCPGVWPASHCVTERTTMECVEEKRTEFEWNEMEWSRVFDGWTDCACAILFIHFTADSNRKKTKSHQMFHFMHTTDTQHTFLCNAHSQRCAQPTLWNRRKSLPKL